MQNIHNTHAQKANLKAHRLHIRFLKQQVIRGYIGVLVCSPGGVGSTFFISFLEKYKSVNSNRDSDGLKHIDRPPLTLNSNLKAIYIFGDPFNAVLSLFRRKAHHYQSKKLLFKHPNIEPIAKDCTLKKYLEEGVDRLRLGDHFENWNNGRVTYPIMLVKYESIWKNLPKIFDYLEIPQSEIKNFPTKKNRNSDWSFLSEDLKKLFYNMYGDLQEKIMNFDDVKIIKPQLTSYIFLPKYALYIAALYKQKLIG